MTRMTIGSKTSVVVLLAAPLLLAGCLHLRVDLQLHDDGSVVAGGVVRSPLFSPDLFSVTNSPKVKAFAEKGKWTIRGVSDKQGWDGMALTKRFPRVRDVYLSETNAPWTLALHNVENDIYELRFEAVDDTLPRFMGEKVPCRHGPSPKGSGIEKFLASDLTVLLLRGIEFGCTFRVPGDIVSTSLHQTGPRKAAIEFVGDKIIRAYFERTEEVPEEEQRGEILAAVFEEHVASPTNAWIRFRWPNGKTLAADAASSGDQHSPPVRETITLTAPPPCTVLSSLALGPVEVLHTTVKTSRAARRAQLRHEVEWKIRMPAEATDGKRYEPLQIDNEKLGPLMTDPECGASTSDLSSRVSVRSSGRNRCSFLAKCTFTAGRLPSSVWELKGSARMLLADMRARGHILKPSGNGVYALQWDKDGTPTLSLIEKRDDELIVYCHSGTSNFLARHEEWKTTPNQRDRVIELTWTPRKKTLSPTLKLYSKVSTCDYRFSLKNVKIP
jgi:hypothetical protein